jgi:hypothetical protein
VIPDREELRRTAAQRVRRTWLISAVAWAVLVIAVTTVSIFATDEPVTVEWIVLSVLPLGVALVIGATSYAASRRKEPPLWYGADRDTQRAVRTGHAPDERVDALAREAAQRDIRDSAWFLAFYAVLLAPLGLLIQRIRTRHDGSMIALAVVLAAAFAVVVMASVVKIRRSRRYLRNAPRGET